MVWLCLGLIPVAFAVSLPLAWVMVRLGHRLGTLDSAGVARQVKLRRAVPNLGGVAIFWGVVLPILAGLVLLGLGGAGEVLGPRLSGELAEHLPGIRERGPMVFALIASLGLLHVTGMIDDRRPLGPWLKLSLMALPAVAIPLLFGDTRLLELLDPHVGGAWLSIVITIAWLVAVTNAMNFMDNMDGLSAGVAAIAGAWFLAAALLSGQWFVAAVLSLVIGACLGFLVFNFPRRGGARVFMGDGGSLVLGFLLAFLTVRTTYYAGEGPGAGIPAGGWYAVFMPLVVLAVPLYDFVSVVSIRLSQGRSPLVGDRQHLSHRLVGRGLSERAALLVIYGLTAVTGAAGVLLATVAAWQAALVAAQTLLLLFVVGVFEYASTRGKRAEPA